MSDISEDWDLLIFAASPQSCRCCVTRQTRRPRQTPSLRSIHLPLSRPNGSVTIASVLFLLLLNSSHILKEYKVEAIAD